MREASQYKINNNYSLISLTHAISQVDKQLGWKYERKVGMLKMYTQFLLIFVTMFLGHRLYRTNHKKSIIFLISGIPSLETSPSNLDLMTINALNTWIWVSWQHILAVSSWRESDSSIKLIVFNILLYVLLFGIRHNKYLRVFIWKWLKKRYEKKEEKR